jgi:hypothetical protein
MKPTLCLKECSNYFLNRTSDAQEIRTRIDKWDCIKLKSCTAKETITRIKKQPRNRREMFASYLLD